MRSASRVRRAATWLGWSVLALSTLTGLIGFAHTPAGRPLLQWLASTAGCPVSLDAGDPVVVEAFRQRQLAARRGDTTERSRPALHFELGQTTRAAALNAMGGAAHCEWTREQTVLRCVDAGVRLADGAQIADLYLQFDSSGVLVALDAMHAELDADTALQRLQQRRTELDQRVGPATHQQGVVSAQALMEGPLRHNAIEYRYRGYVARVSAINMGSRGVRLREQYQALTASPAS